jgi:hypothetical protein
MTAIYYIFAALHLVAAIASGVKADGDPYGFTAAIILGVTGGLLVAAGIAR